jgi:hypothetical protein
MADDVLSEVLPEDRVPVARPDGSLTSVKKTNYDAALGQGYRFQTPEEQTKFHAQLKYGDRPLAAGAAGALRGATLGLSDVAGPKLGLVEKETLAGLKEQNPGASTLGDVAGTAASLLIPGLGEVSGPALAAKAGARAVEAVGLKGATSLAGKLAGRAVSGGLEGAIFSGGSQVSEAALGDPDLTAQKIVSHVGLGALLGAGGSIVGGAASDSITKGAGGIEQLLHTKAEDFAAKAIGGIQSSFRGMEKDEVRAIARDVIDSGIIGKTDRATDILPKIQAAKKQAGKAIGEVLDAVDATGVKPTYATLHSRLDAFEAALNPAEKDLVQGQLKDVRRYLDEMGSSPKNGFAALNDLKSSLQGSINYKTDPSEKLKLAKQVVGIVRDELDTQLKANTLPEEFAQFQKAKDLYGSFAEAEKWGKRGVKALLGNRTFSLTDYLGAQGLSSLTGGLPGIALGAAGAVGNKMLRERGPAAATHALEYLATHGDPAAIGAVIGKGVAGVVTGGASAATSGLMGSKEQHLSTLAQHLDEHDDDLDHHVDQVFRSVREPHQASDVLKTQDFGAKRMRRDEETAHQQRVAEIQHLAANPEALLDRVTANSGMVASVAPGVGGALARTAQAAVDYLAKAAEQPPKAGPLARDWVAPVAERWAFARKLEVVQDPKSVLRHAAAGTLTSDQMEALTAVYPLLARQIADKALQKLTESPQVPYRARLMVGMLTNTDPDGSMGLVASNQLAIQSASKKPSNTMGPGAPPSSGKSPLTLAQRTATGPQKSELQQQE